MTLGFFNKQTCYILPESVYSPFSHFFIQFSYPKLLTITFSKMLNKHGDNNYFNFYLDFEENA